MAHPGSTIIGNSKIIREILSKADRVARTSLSVLVTGESGTGKELLARFLHDRSQRVARPYVAVNCAAIPAELLEAELFGYKKGSFSGAVSDRDGLFVQADGGTLFLDEIGDMPLPLQAKILRVLQEKEVRPVGGRDVRKVDVRIVAATHRNPAELVSQGKFREDLLFRLQGYALHLPPLRERDRDVIALARVMLHSCPEFAGKELSREVQELLLAYSWPGNVRELRNVVLAAAVDAPRSIKARHILPHLADKGASITVTPVLPVQERLLAELKERGQQTLAQLHHGLHILKSTLHYHIKKLMAQGKIQRLAEGSRVRFTVADDAEGVQQDLPGSQIQAVRTETQAGKVTRQQMASAVGISIRAAGRVLALLVNMGIMTPDGQGGEMSSYLPCRL